jgi:hypothetical protein
MSKNSTSVQRRLFQLIVYLVLPREHAAPTRWCFKRYYNFITGGRCFSESVQGTVFQEKQNAKIVPQHSLRSNHRAHTKWQWLISGVHSIMMEKSALGAEGGGCMHTHPLSLYLPSRKKLQRTFQLRGQIHSFIYTQIHLFHLYPRCNLWF